MPIGFKNYRILGFVLTIFCLMTAASHAVIDERVVICGVCRDVATRLPFSIKIMEQIGALFNDYRIIIYENNSLDQTVSILKSWAHQNPKVFCLSENLSDSELELSVINRLDDGEYFRPELIARARNIVLDVAMSETYQAFTYLIWMDMDFVIPPAFEGIVETFESKREWDAVLAYGIDPSGIHWDWYAFRDDAYPIGSELLGNAWWYMSKHFELNASNDWYPVYSAFGGCGIYKKSSIEQCRYSAIVTKDLEACAKRIIEKGKRSRHPQILRYLDLLTETSAVENLDSLNSSFADIRDPNTGIRIDSGSLIWRMSSFVYYYPSTCEHVPFHASMIMRGHDKIFINPRLIFHYGG